MKLAMTGATGFTGWATLPLLLERGHSVRCLVRRPALAGAIRAAGAEVVLGDLGDDHALAETFRDRTALVNVASLGFGHADRLIRAAEEAGIARAIFISTTAIFTRLNAPSRAVRIAAEEAIRGSGLRWTILRPTMIYGSDRDRNICRLIGFLEYSPVLPVFGPGTAFMQPIFVDDLALAIVSALNAAASERQCYNLAGAAPLNYNELARSVAGLMKRRVRLWHLPAAPVMYLLRILEGLKLSFPLKAEQVARLQEDKAFSWDEAARDFGFSPRTFKEGVRIEIARMGLM